MVQDHNIYYTRKELLVYIYRLEQELGLISSQDRRDLIAAVERGQIPLKDVCCLIDNIITLGKF